MSIKDFNQFVGNQNRAAGQRGVPVGMNVPIIGQAHPVIKDAIGRVLEVGDFIVLQSTVIPPFRVQEVVKDPATGAMRIKITATTYFMAPPDLPQVEFIRVMTRAEVEASRPANQQQQQTETPAAPSEPIDPPLTPET